MDFGMFVPWVVATKSLVGRVQQAVARSVKWILFRLPPTAFCFFAFEMIDPRIALSTSDITSSDQIWLSGVLCA